MDRALFGKIFENDILPFVRELDANNSLIILKDLSTQKEKIFQEYSKLNNNFKENVFGKKDGSEALLDRHRVAACFCGAFLRTSMFDKTKMIEELKRDKQLVEVYFYYVNEFVAFFAGTKILSFYMIADHKGDSETVKKIAAEFPQIPETTRCKRGFWNTVLFNLAEIKNEQQIGLEHFDMYAYAMIYYWLERDFNRTSEAA